MNGTKIRSYLKRTDAEYWQVLAFPFLEGGPYTADDVARANRVGRDQRHHAGPVLRRGAGVGRTIEADGQTFTVSGVVDDVPMLRLFGFSDIWVPYTTAKSDGYRSELVGDFVGILLLAPGADARAVQREFKARLAHACSSPTRRTSTSSTPTRRRLRHGGADAVRRAGARGTTGSRLRIAMALGALLFMLLPAINLVNLNVSRILERASEIGVRKAFGASSWTLVGQFLVENLLLTCVGALVGVGAAAAGARGGERERRAAVRRPGAEPAGARLGRAARGGVRGRVGRLPGVADVAPPPGRRAARRDAMTRHLLRLVWNRKRTTLLVMVEIAVAFLVLFAVVAVATYAAGQLAPAGRVLVGPGVGHRGLRRGRPRSASARR